MALNVESLPSEADQFQAYLSELSGEQLSKLEPALVEHFQNLRNSDEFSQTDEGKNRLTIVATQISSTREEVKRREQSAATAEAERAAAAHKDALANLDKIVAGEVKADTAQNSVNSETESAVASMAKVFAGAIEQAVQNTQANQGVVTAGGKSSNLNNRIRSLNAMQNYAPDARVAHEAKEAVLVASADIPGRAKNGLVNGVNDLIQLMGNRARMLPVTRGNPNYVPVAYKQRDFRYRLTLDSTPEEVNEVLTAATDVDALVAAGGWCAPSEISYDFFNIVCEDGLVDLPSVGVLNRGGFRFPQSPSISDVFADSDALWSWTEQNDEDAATDPELVKTCARIPCPDFEEVRAACDGLCITASNLTDFAYPELISNYLQLVMAARAHRTNQLVIQELVGDSTAVNMSGSPEGATASILNAVELQALDYRERYRMCQDAVLEAVFPRWVHGVIRADLANRSGLSMFDVTNGMIADWFDRRFVSAQFVADWQSGFNDEPIGSPAAIATDWPDTVDFLLYAPGTFVRGQGLQLDLGVVRDSTLNAQNDHTAAWSEDCYAVAMVGHESRIVTTGTCTAGVTGASDIACEVS